VAGAGRSIDRIIRIDETGGGGGGPIPMPRLAMMREAAQDASAPPPISAGQTEIRANVTLTAVLK
jgi:uncharacterized protein YggE